MREQLDAGSCDLPEPALDRAALAHRKFDPGTFTWDGITPQVYKHGDQGRAGLGWHAVTRQTLAGGGTLAFQLRYFELGPSGFSSLEKHRHAHTIIVLRGKGTVLAGREIFAVEPFDLVVIPPAAPHQFVNAGIDPFGFLCPVDADRDPPQVLDDEELRSLRQDPRTRDAIRLTAPVSSP